MVLASVATTSFDILLLFSLPSCLHLRATPFSAEGVGACLLLLRPGFFLRLRALPIYLTVYYLCRLEIPMFSS
jgi:hypothetical protein